MNDAPYNTPAGIRDYLKEGIAGLTRLRNDRHEAAYGRREELREFVLLQRFATDSCGNTGILHQNKSILGATLPEVMSFDGFVSQGFDLSWSLFGGRIIAGVEDTCAECGKQWTLDNAEDQMRGSEDKKYHVGCLKTVYDRNTRKQMEECFEKAGIPVTLNPIPNEYHSDHLDDWYLAETSFGTIKLGWRRSVISIDWSKTKAPETVALKTKALFKDESVTLWETGIHAWGYAKAATYLKAIKEALEP